MIMGQSALLLFLSRYNPQSSEREYRYRGRAYRGIQTNDAPCKAMLQEANENGYPVGQILCIASGEVMTSVTATGKTQFENFREMIVDYTINDLVYEKKPEIVAIPYDFTLENEMQDLDSSPRVLRVYQDIADHLGKQKTPVIYIDYTGGMRDISLLMMTVVRHLEWIGVSCKRIVYSNLEDLTIYDIGYIYEMLRLIDSTNNFVATGTARNLRQIFEGLKREGSDESDDWEKTDDALKSLEKFSDAISLCDISNIGALASDMNLKLGEVMNSSKDVSSIYLRMFKTLIPQIRKKMYADRWNDQSEIYFSLISWTAENMMLQQALTLYVEKMPVVYMDEKNVFCEWMPDYVVFSSDTAVSQFYEDLFSAIRSQGSMEREFAELLKEINSSCAEQGIDDLDDIRSVIRHQKREISLRLDLNNEEAEKLDEAIHRLLVYLENFSDSGRGEEIYSQEVRERNIRNFISAAANNYRYQHYFLFNDQSEYEVSHPPRRNGERQTAGAFTYRTKIQALKRLEQESGEQAGDLQKLLEIMQYYLAVKYLRNKMNHASEQTDTEDETALKRYLSESAHINPEMSMENIQRIIQDGLRISGWET